MITIGKSTFIKLRKVFLIAFSLIVGVLLIAQVLIQQHLNTQLNNSKITSVFKIQRLLSQKIVKEVLYLQQPNSNLNKKEILLQLKKDLQEFKNSHLNLQNEIDRFGNQNNTELKVLYTKINYHYNTIVKVSSKIIEKHDLKNDHIIPKYVFELDSLYHAEKTFLNKMNGIVFKYNEISFKEIKQLKSTVHILLFVVLIVLLLEFLLFFRPVSVHIKKIIDELVNANQKIQDKTIKIEALYKSKEASLLELKGLNFAIDNAALFVSIAQDGTIVHVSKKFAKLLGIERKDIKGYLGDLLSLNEGEQQTIKELLKGKRRSIWIGELQVTTAYGNILWIEMSIIPINKVQNNQRALILCADITKRIESQKEIDILNEQRFAEQRNQQKTLSSQIVDAQEEERKRIAKDIHDGIGQMLTALKFNIESFNIEKIEATKEKVKRLKALLKKLIKEVRTVTFNLTPPELGDHGIVATLGKLTRELSKFTGKNVYFENKTNFNGRFDSLTEINLYRVVQEAVNNSLKYAASNYILVSLSHSKDVLSIVIDDDGKGFDYDKLIKRKKGMGLFFMKERINYINGRLFINSSIEKGTRITINIKINSTTS